MNQSDRLTVAEVSKIASERAGFEVPENTVRSWIKRGQLPVKKIFGRVFVSREDLEKFLSDKVE
ncbi:helix-turn-helix domain-containing protein [Pontibacter sp. G13]|uniref:helix-turn-helix domain-containing protein n=1 Tax=Pontibacter sp. G13 TaxID=3074898 RepID=UPI0039061B96